MAAVEEKKQGGFFKRLISIEAPLKFGILGSALFVGLAMLQAVLAPGLFAVAQTGVMVGGVIGIVNNIASAVSSL